MTSKKQITFEEMPDSGFIRINQLVRDPKNPTANPPLPFSAPTLWRKVKAKTFPQPVSLGTRITAWRVSEVRKWLEEVSTTKYTPRVNVWEDMNEN